MKLAWLLVRQFIYENKENLKITRREILWEFYVISELQDLFIIVLGALLIFGPKRLTELGQSIGKMLAEFKVAVNKTDNDKKDEEDKDKN